MASRSFARALVPVLRRGALPALAIMAAVTVLADRPASAQSEPVQMSSWVDQPGSNRFAVGLNGLGGTHATPMFASPTDITGWGITDMKTRTPSPAIPADASPGEGIRSPEASGNDLDGLLPPLDQR